MRDHVKEFYRVCGSLLSSFSLQEDVNHDDDVLTQLQWWDHRVPGVVHVLSVNLYASGKCVIVREHAGVETYEPFDKVDASVVDALRDAFRELVY
jgi:hypothetical protein